MPGIWNINNGYNVNTKKVSSKLTFEVGERFTGRIVEKGDGKDVTIKLADGWQFIAELEGNVNLDDIKLVKFQVEGFQNGKLNLKLVDGATEDETIGDENFQEVIEKEGLSKEDIDILKKMVKHNISLTRDNINQIRGLFQFNEKMSANPREIDSFIQTYLQSKDIPINSDQGQAVKEMLTKFFNEFKTMTQEDILAFVENNLDFSEENISSFNKLFKGGESIEQILFKIRNSLNELDIENNVSKNNFESIMDSKLVNKEANILKNYTDNTTAFASKAYNENDPLSKKINVLDVLKTLARSEDSELDIVQKNAGKENNQVKNEKINLSASLNEKLENKEIVKLIKDTMGNSLTNTNIDTAKTQAERLIESTNKTKLEGLLSSIDGKEVKLTDQEFKAFKEAFNNKIAEKPVAQENIVSDKNNIQPKEVSSNIIKEANVAKDTFGKLNFETLAKGNLEPAEAIKVDMKNKIDNVRDIVKNLINQTELKDVSDKVMNLIKSNINDFKVFNSISNEYYYLNMPIKAENTEYPCQLIIKDNRKDGKKIDSTNTKMVVSVKTINLGDVDGYLTMKENRIDVNLKCENNFMSVLNNNKSKLVNGLSSLGLLVNVTVSAREKPVDLVSCRNFFNDLTISTIDIKV
ncbi:flagellar hook-length control protein FliK [Clostridium sp. C2-6-12]|uniref:flagellar hook-length control protein FliK n=1 Tax=Clostridium sp. C2-6-12 TaxID=2698832 RepID=UPI00136B4A94|nr:flagellar hook-length control protein FliK [Clostridium sp. C2-6-12]